MKRVYYLKKTDNGFKHVLNECEELKEESEVLLDELYRINNNNVELLSAISNNYYRKRFRKDEENSRPIKIIKGFISIIHRCQKIKKKDEEREKDN